MINQPKQGKELIDGLKRGDTNALQKCFDRYNRSLYVMVDKIVKRGDVAEGIVVEAFEKLWRYRERVNDIGHLCSFLYIVARNDAIEYFRYRGREQKALKGFSQLAELTWQEPTEKEMEMNQLVERLYLQIKLLPPQGRKILILHFFKNKEVKVIAQLMNLKEQTVRNHIGRSVHSLRRSLSAQWMLLMFILLLFAE